MARFLRRDEASLRNHLRSVERDATCFVASLRSHFYDVSCFANLRGGAWYTSEADGACYFKSTDGHISARVFSLSRLNLHIGRHLASSSAEAALIVDATRSGKLFPDAESRTIPLWCGVLNQLLLGGEGHVCVPSFIPPSEAHLLNERVKTIVNGLPEGTVEIIRKQFSSSPLRGPIRPIWLCSPELRAVEDGHDVRPLFQTFLCSKCASADCSLGPSPSLESILEASYGGTGGDPRRGPVILCVSASQRLSEHARDVSVSHRTGHLIGHGDESSAVAGWRYLPGAGDDAEHWSRGLTPSLFWRLRREIMESDAFTRGTHADCEALIDALVAREVAAGRGGSAVSAHLATNDEDVENDGTSAAPSDYLLSVLVPLHMTGGGLDISRLEDRLSQSRISVAPSGLMERAGAGIAAFDKSVEGASLVSLSDDLLSRADLDHLLIVAPMQGNSEATVSDEPSDAAPHSTSDSTANVAPGRVSYVHVPVDKKDMRQYDGIRLWRSVFESFESLIERLAGGGPARIAVIPSCGATEAHALVVAAALAVCVMRSSARVSSVSEPQPRLDKTSLRVMLSVLQTATGVPTVPRLLHQQLNSWALQDLRPEPAAHAASTLDE